jgi:threonine synthase
LKYYSTNLASPEVSFREALLQGLAPDGGLYLPYSFPVLTQNELKSFSGKDYHEIAFVILNKFIGEEIDSHDLADLCREAYNFDIPLEKVLQRKYIMRLDQGPTASFKDFAARMMSRLMQYYLAADNQQLTILTATSGDTGSAVANAFYGMKNIRVIILYPAGEVTPMQRKQMTTLHGNIKVISIKGKFDDCQKLVKTAFQDPLLSHIPLSSANSINIGRLLPQTVYYFYAWSRLAASLNDRAIFSVPSGNFGNLMGGLIAKRMGLPAESFIVATNENREVPEFLKTGFYKPIKPSVNCISSAMNVGHPSNLARIIDLYGGKMDEDGNVSDEPNMDMMRKELYGVSVSDAITKVTISDVHRKFNTILEPHGAVAWKGIEEYIRSGRGSASGNKLFISLETAHPAKFPDELKQIIGRDPDLPHTLSGLTGKKEDYISIENNYENLKHIILNN